MKLQPAVPSARHRGVGNWRIASKLLAASLCLSLIPLLLATWISTRSTREALTQQQNVNVARLSNNIAQHISQALTSGHLVMDVVASDAQTVAVFGPATDAERQRLKSEADGHIANILSSSPAVDVVGVYDGKGTVMAHSDPSAVGKDFSGREQVRRALGGEAFTSGLLVDPKTDTVGINLSEPVRRGSQVVGAVAIHIKGDYLTGILNDSLDVDGEAISSSDRASIGAFLVDSNGIVVAAPNDPAWLYRSLGEVPADVIAQIKSTSALGIACPSGVDGCSTEQKIARLPASIPGTQALADQLQDALRSGQSGSLRYCRAADLDQAAAGTSCNGDWHVAGYAPVEMSTAGDRASTGLFLALVDLPESIFLQGVVRQTAQGIAVSVVIAFLAVIASVLIARTISTPIKQLAVAAKAVEEDQQFQPEQLAAVAARGDEVGQLARVFTAMVVALRARMIELRTIYDIGRKISSSVDLQQTIEYLLASIRGAIPYDAAEVCLYDKERDAMILEAVADGAAVTHVEGTSYQASRGLLAGIVARKEALLLQGPLLQGPEAVSVDGAGIERTWQGVQPLAYLGVPLLANGELVGTIELVQRRPDAFSQDHQRLLDSIALQAAIAVQNARNVLARERTLTAQIHDLRIEIDDLKKAKQVEEIVSTDYFQRLREQAQTIRDRRKDGLASDDTA